MEIKQEKEEMMEGSNSLPPEEGQDQLSSHTSGKVIMVKVLSCISYILIREVAKNIDHLFCIRVAFT